MPANYQWVGWRKGEAVPLKASDEHILNFIKEYIEMNSWAPSVREIAKGVGFNSPSTAHVRLKQLEAKGAIIYKGVRQIRVIV